MSMGQDLSARRTFRSKVTLACDACRKRRIKCSGSAPCAYCADNMITCVYDEKHRGRRGPRPSRAASERVLHPLEPAFPRPAQTAAINAHAINGGRRTSLCSVNGNDTLIPRKPTEQQQQEQKSPVHLRTPNQQERHDSQRQQAHNTQSMSFHNQSKAPQLPVSPVVGAPELMQPNYSTHIADTQMANNAMSNVHILDEDTTYESPDLLSPQVEGADARRAPLQRLITKNADILALYPSLSVDLVVHLLELFYAHGHAQIKAVVPSADIYSRIQREEISLGVIIAMCANSSRFSNHKSIRQSSAPAQHLAKRARAFLNEDDNGSQVFDDILMICVLADYEASRCCGRNAWVDICIAKGLVQVFKASENESTGAKRIQAAEAFLRVAEMTYSLGYPSLLSELSSSLSFKSTNKEPDVDSSEHVFTQLCGTMATIETLYTTPIFKQDPPPWKAGSSYRQLQSELEDYAVQKPYTIPDVERQTGEAGEDGIRQTMCFMLSQCCIIKLNKHYLPITQAKNPNNRSSSNMEFTIMDFPHAPILFVKDKIRRCESSAEAICHALRITIKQGGFYPFLAFIGYVAMEGASVFINMIQRKSEKRKEQMSNNLSILCTVLAAVRQFYTPAQDWLNALSAIWRGTMSPLNERNATMAAFENYYSRFASLRAPAFVPFDLPQASAPSGSQVQAAPSTRQEGPMKHAEGVSISAPPDQPTDKTPSWVAAYTDQLKQTIDDTNMRASELEAEGDRRTSSAGNNEASGQDTQAFNDVAPSRSLDMGTNLATGAGLLLEPRIAPNSDSMDLCGFGPNWTSLMAGLSPSVALGADPSNFDLDMDAFTGPLSWLIDPDKQMSRY